MALTEKEVIYNLALGYIGEYKVEDSVASRALSQYTICDRYYELARDEALASHPWNEATEDIILCQSTELPIMGYERKYLKPSNCLRVLSVDNKTGADVKYNSRGVIPWEVKKDYIHSNAGVTPPTWATGTDYYKGQFVSDSSITYECLVTHESGTLATDVTSGYMVSKGGDYRIVYVSYIFRLTDTTKYSPKLKKAIAQKLAIEVVVPLTKNNKAKADLINEFEGLTMPSARSVDAQQGTPKPLHSSDWLRSRQTGGGGWFVR